MTLSQRDAVLAEIVELSGVPVPREPEEFTTREFAEFAQLSWNGASGRLEKLLEAGAVERRRGIVDNRQCWLYRKVGP